MKRILKYIVARTYKPWLVKHLSRTQSYVYKGIVLEIPPEVFHPKFFFSTKLLLRYVSHLSLSGKSFLELGAGSGLISIFASKKGAQVTASDINPAAVKAVQKNALANNVSLTVIHSDLFDQIPEQVFDVIAINPPYYKKKPVANIDYAWFCGEEGEYFQGLFKDLRRYVQPGSKVILILCDGCDIEMVQRIAAQNCFRLNCVETRQNLLEANFIYTIGIIDE
jgi:release factor glutamine methyltransferase